MGLILYCIISREILKMNTLINQRASALYRKLAKKLAKWEKIEYWTLMWLEEGLAKNNHNRYHHFAAMMHNEIKTAQDLYKKKIDNLIKYP